MNYLHIPVLVSDFRAMLNWVKCCVFELKEMFDILLKPEFFMFSTLVHYIMYIFGEKIHIPFESKLNHLLSVSKQCGTSLQRAG